MPLQDFEEDVERHRIYKKVPKVGVLEIIGNVCVPRGCSSVAEFVAKEREYDEECEEKEMFHLLFTFNYLPFGTNWTLL